MLASMPLHRACRNPDSGNLDITLSVFERNDAAPQKTLEQTTNLKKDESTTPLISTRTAEGTHSPCAADATGKRDEAALPKTSTTTTDANEDAQP